MEPILIEDVPSSVTDEGMNPLFGNAFSSAIPIIEDEKIPAETLIEIHDETIAETLAATRTKTKLTQYLKEPSYTE